MRKIPLILLSVLFFVSFVFDSFADDSHIVPSDKREATKPGDTRKSTTGAVLSRATDADLKKLGVDPEKCGEAWIEPNQTDGKKGKTWCDIARKADGSPLYLNHEDPVKHCESMGAKREKGKYSEIGYAPQILPGLTYSRPEGLVKAGYSKKIESYFLWTATFSKESRFRAEIFYAGDGHVGEHYDPKTTIMAFRCIAGPT